MVKKILEECDACVILIRAMPLSPENPYVCDVVWNKIQKWVDKTKYNVRVIIVPGDDLTVYHGRKVGWDVKKIRLDKETEAISATKIRDDNLGHG